jgi:hypothetical protein
VYLHWLPWAQIGSSHRHIRNIDCLKACTACHVCFSSTVNGHSKRKRSLLTIKTGASSGHIKLTQSILLRCLWITPICAALTKVAKYSIVNDTGSFGKKYWPVYVMWLTECTAQTIEEHVFYSYAGKQQSWAATDVKSTLVLKKWTTYNYRFELWLPDVSK